MKIIYSLPLVKNWIWCDAWLIQRITEVVSLGYKVIYCKAWIDAFLCFCTASELNPNEPIPACSPSSLQPNEFYKKDLFNDDFGPSGSKKETRSLHSWHDKRLNKSWQVIKLMMKNDSAICGLQPSINCMITHQAGVNYQWLCIINYVKQRNFKITFLFNLSKPHTVCLIDCLFQLMLLFYKTQ